MGRSSDDFPKTEPDQGLCASISAPCSLACTTHVPCMYLACTSHEPGLHLPITWLVPGLYLPCTWLWRSFGVPFGGFARPFFILHSSFCIRPRAFTISHPNTTPLPRAPRGGLGGTLDKPWTCPGTIEPPQTPVFDQPSLSRPLSCGISSAERLSCEAGIWSALARRLRPCGPCSAQLDL